MAEKNPAKNIDRLRAAPGTEEVIPASSLDQFDPATSYKVGPSSMTADMTPSDWPDTGKGIINTSRSDDDFAVQQFQPLGSSDIYQRRWDSTPLNYSDDFNQDNGTPPDPVKWTIFGTGEPFIENNYLRFNTQCGINSDYQFIGDFDVQARMYKEGVASNHLSFLLETEANKTSTSTHAVTGFGIAQLGVNTINSYLTGSTSSNQHALPTGAVWFYIRIIRTGTWIDIYLGTDGISWGAPIRSGNQHVDLTGTGVFRIRNALGNASFPCRLDDYIINSGVVQPDSATSAYWSDWQIFKDADTLNQDTTDAITEHATVTYDHDRLGAEIGAEQVIPDSQFDQYDPLTSYNLGQSVMLADQTINEWPVNGQGIVNTSKTSDDDGSQNFTPRGTSDLHIREWNDTPIDVSDDFTGTVIDGSKWTEILYSNSPTIAQNDELTISLFANVGSAGLESKYGFQGDFDIQVEITAKTNLVTAGIAVAPVSKIGDRPTQSTTDWTWLISYTSDNQLYANVGGISDFLQIETVGFYRITRSNTTMTLYYKTLIGDAWTEIKTGPHSNEEFFVVLYYQSGSTSAVTKVVTYDDYVVNQGTVNMFAPASSTWQPWFILSEPYDHTQILSDISTNTADITTNADDILLKQDIIPVSETEPVAPEENDLWIDTST